MGVVADMAGGRARWAAVGQHSSGVAPFALRLGRPPGESLVPTWSEPATAALLGVVFPLGGVAVECSFPPDVGGAKISG